MATYKFKHREFGWRLVNTPSPASWARKDFVAEVGDELIAPLKDDERINPETGAVEPDPVFVVKQAEKAEDETVKQVLKNRIDSLAGMTFAEFDALSLTEIKRILFHLMKYTIRRLR